MTGGVGIDQIGRLKSILDSTDQLVNVAAPGLDAAIGSVAYVVSEIEKHLHTRERWLGIRSPQTATLWAAKGVTNPYIATSGNNTWGAAIQLIGTDDTPIIPGTTMFDPHRVLIVGVSQETQYLIRISYGSGTQADAITADQYSEIMIKFDPLAPQESAGIPFPIKFPRQNSGVDKLWAECWNVTNGATVSFFIGIHEYTG